MQLVTVVGSRSRVRKSQGPIRSERASKGRRRQGIRERILCRPDDRQTARDEQSVFTVVLCQRVASDSLAEGWREGDGWRLDALIGVKQNAEAHFLTMERSEMVEEIGSILFPHLLSPIGGFSFSSLKSHVALCDVAIASLYGDTDTNNSLSNI